MKRVATFAILVLMSFRAFATDAEITVLAVMTGGADFSVVIQRRHQPRALASRLDALDTH